MDQKTNEEEVKNPIVDQNKKNNEVGHETPKQEDRKAEEKKTEEKKL